MAISMQAAARRLVERGLGVTPLAPRSKTPILQSWPSCAITKALEGDALAAALSSAFPDGQNVGAVWGAASSDLVDVDLDHAITAQLAPHLLPTTRSYGRKSRPTTHWLYRAPGAHTLKLRVTGEPIAGVSGMLVELKAGGQQSAVPPSIHPSGERYTWDKGTPPVQDIAASDLERRIRLLGAGTVLAALWTAGSRHDLALALAGAMLRSGWTANDCAYLLGAVCAVADDPDVQDRSRAVTATASNLTQGRPASGLPELARLIGERGVDFLKRALNLANALQGIQIDSAAALETATGEEPVIMTRSVVDVQERPINWLWPNRFARGKLSMLAGKQGLSKSTLTCEIAAIVSRGGVWPIDGTTCEPGEVLILNVEDDPGDTIRPRLRAADAVLERVTLIDGVRLADGRQRLMTFADVVSLDRFLDRHRRRFTLLIADPIGAFLAGKDSHKDSEVRELLAPFSAMAERHSLAVLLVAHLNKASAMDAIYRILGSVGFTAAARTLYVVAADPDDSSRILLLPEKSNIAPAKMAGLAYRLENTDLGNGICAGRLRWESGLEMRTADEVLNPPRREAAAERADAEAWLKDQLAAGPALVHELRDAAKGELAMSWRTVERAATTLKVHGAGARNDRTWQLQTAISDEQQAADDDGEERI